MISRSKYILSTILALFITAGLCSCNDGATLYDRQKAITGAAVTWEYGGITYTGAVTLNGDIPADGSTYRDSAVTVNSPDAAAGMTVAYSGERAEATVGDVSLALPAGMGTEMYFLVKSLSLTSDERVGAGSGVAGASAVEYAAVVCGRDVSFTIEYTEGGFPARAHITWQGGEKSMDAAFECLFAEEGT